MENIIIFRGYSGVGKSSTMMDLCARIRLNGYSVRIEDLGQAIPAEKVDFRLIEHRVKTTHKDGCGVIIFKKRAWNSLLTALYHQKQ